MRLDANPEFVTLRKACRRWRLLSGCLAGPAALVVLLAAAAPEAIQTVLNGDVLVTGSLKCKQVQVIDAAAFTGEVSVKKKLTAEEIDSPTITKIQEELAAIRNEIALSRPYVVATMPGLQDPVDNTNQNPGPFVINGLQADVPRRSLPAIVVVTLRVQRPPRRASEGTMDIRINGETMSMVEVADFGHQSENTYTSSMALAQSDQLTTKVTVTANTYNFGGLILSGSLVVIPLGSLPR